ncbi:helix-turn-helix domain-containing protein [Mesorhizobium sp. L-8-10]|uniref:helix-turn-helix domain-containing protein n=1 Tax=Mesorhizobium sp. L-8-10 TaxID=2744523 RepID=UPI0019258E3E
MRIPWLPSEVLRIPPTGQRPKSALAANAGLRTGILRTEGGACHAAVDRARGNLSAAARLLGLTRAQLAYRLGAGGGPAAV